MDMMFDATGIPPEQGGGGHPEGQFPFRISNAETAPTKNNTGTMLVVTFETPSGSIKNYYNLWINSPQAVAIAKKELSALCHAIGIFQLPNVQGFGLIGQPQVPQGQIIVGKQANGEYVEIKKVLDIHGNEPGKAPKAPAAATGFSPPPAAAPAAAAPAIAGAWGTPPAAGPAASAAPFVPPPPAAAVPAAAPATAAPAQAWTPPATGPGPAPSWGPPR